MARLLLDFVFMFGIGIQEFGLILVVALLVFGPKRIPELARMLGKGMGEFRRASNDLRQSLALDDLENDLRRDLHSAQSMLKKEMSTDRPPQAGDDVPAVPAAPKAGQHQGELPLGNDYAHNDVPDEPAADGTDSAPSPMTKAKSSATSEAASRPGKTSDPADAERG